MEKKRRILFATGNADKLREIREIMKDSDYEILSMKEAGIRADIVENGETFEENALIKARAVCALSGEIAMADDSGLEIDHLGRNPESTLHGLWERIPPMTLKMPQYSTE